MPETSHNITIADTHVHYLSAGEESEKYIVLLHGASFTSATWVETGTIDALARTGWHVIAFDLPGYGQSVPSTIPRDRWVQSALDALQIDKPMIVSPSMSGSFTLPFVTKHPNRVAGYIAVAPVGLPNFFDQLSQVTFPVLAIWGEHDRVVPVSHGNIFVQRVEHAKLIIIPNAGHACYMNDPNVFNDRLVGFLEK